MLMLAYGPEGQAKILDRLPQICPKVCSFERAMV